MAPKLKRAALSEAILGLSPPAAAPAPASIAPAPAPAAPAAPRDGRGLAEAPSFGAGGGPASRSIVGTALEVHRQGLLEKLEKLEAERDAETGQGTRLVGLDPALIDDPLPADRDPRAFEDAAFTALMASIEEHGQHVPILVRVKPAAGPGAAADPAPAGEEAAVPGPTRYEIAAGRRRLAACRALGRPVMARVLPLDEAAMLALQYRENAERADVSAFERGRWLARLAHERGFSTTRLAALLGLSQPSIVEYLKLGRLPGALIERLADPRALGLADARRLAAALARDEGALGRMLVALDGAERGIGTRRQLVLALAAARAAPAPDAAEEARAIVRDSVGRKLLTVTRSGSQVVWRWAPGLDPDLLAGLAHDLPAWIEARRRPG